MSSKQSKRMRQFAKEHMGVIDNAFAKQRPWWFKVARKIAPLWNWDKILARPLERWRDKMAPKNAEYRAYCMKVLSRTATKIKNAYEAGKA